jgi:hypothetical protein
MGESRVSVPWQNMQWIARVPQISDRPKDSVRTRVHMYDWYDGLMEGFMFTYLGYSASCPGCRSR